MRRMWWVWGGVGLLAAGGLATGADRLLNPPPTYAEGRAFMIETVDLLTRPGLLDAGKDQVLARLPEMGVVNDRPADCYADMTLRRPGRFVRVFNIEFRKPYEGDCADLQPNRAELSIRNSTFVTPGGFVEYLTRRFGQPTVDGGQAEQSGRHSFLIYRWHVLPNAQLLLTVRLYPDQDDDFELEANHQAGTAGSVPTEAESTAWMSQFIADATDPALLQAHGPGLSAKLGAPRPQGPANACPTYYNPQHDPSPHFSQTSYSNDEAPLSACERAPFRAFSAYVWETPGVTPDAFEQQVTERLGGASYASGGPVWRTSQGLEVSLSEVKLDGQVSREEFIFTVKRPR